MPLQNLNKTTTKLTKNMQKLCKTQLKMKNTTKNEETLLVFATTETANNDKVNYKRFISYAC